MTEADALESLGEEGIQKMVASFYQHVRTDDLLAPMYPADDWEGAEERLADFIIFRLGGSQRYLEKRGHPRLRMRHVHFSIGVAERDRWLQLMGQAMNETNVPQKAVDFLSPFFSQVADFMRNQPSGD